MNSYAPPLQGTADNLAQYGRYGDSMLVHMNPIEVQGIAALSPTGRLTTNPVTGQQEAFLPFLAPLLGSWLGLGAGGSALLSGALTWAKTGDLGKGILGGLTSFGMGKILDAIPSSVDVDVPGVLPDATGVTDVVTDAATTGLTDAQTSGLLSGTLTPGETLLSGDSTLGSNVFQKYGTGSLTDAATSAIEPQDLWGRGLTRDGRIDWSRAGELDFSKDVAGNLIGAAAPVAELGRLDMLEGLEKTQAGLDADREASLAEAEEGHERAMRQSIYDYGWPERGIKPRDPRYAPTGYGATPMTVAGGGLISLNPSDYNNKREGLARLMGEPVRMNGGGMINDGDFYSNPDPYYGNPSFYYGNPSFPDPLNPNAGSMSANTPSMSAAQIQGGLRGPQAISPDQMRQLAAAGHRPGIDPEIQFFRQPEEYPSFLDPLNPNAPPLPDDVTIPTPPEDDDDYVIQPFGTGPGAGEPPPPPGGGPSISNRDRYAALEARYNALPDGRARNMLKRQMDLLDDAYGASGDSASAFPGMLPESTDIYSDDSSLSPEDLAEIYGDSSMGPPAVAPQLPPTLPPAVAPQLPPTPPPVAGGLAQKGRASRYQDLISRSAPSVGDSNLSPEDLAGISTGMPAPAPAPAPSPAPAPVPPVNQGSGRFGGYEDLISKFTKPSVAVPPPLPAAAPPLPPPAASVELPEFDPSNIGGLEGMFAPPPPPMPPAAAPPPPMPPAAVAPPAAVPPMPPMPPPQVAPPMAARPPVVPRIPSPSPVVAAPPPLVPPSVAVPQPSVADWSEYGGWSGLPSIAADQKAAPKAKAKKKTKKKAKKKSKKGSSGRGRKHEGGLIKMQDMGQVPEMESGIASVDPSMGDMDAEAMQLVELTAMAVLGHIPQEQVDAIIQAFIQQFGPEAFQMFRQQVLNSVEPGAQTEGLIKGQGDGMSDEVMGSIGDQQRVATSPGEYIVTADVVSALGNGSSDAGAGELDRMMADIRQAKTGMTEQPAAINPEEFMPA